MLSAAHGSNVELREPWGRYRVYLEACRSLASRHSGGDARTLFVGVLEFYRAYVRTVFLCKVMGLRVPSRVSS